MPENKSEVARLMRQIQMEYEAAQQGLSGLAAVSRHDFITARMENIGEHHVALQQLIGEQKAIHFLAQVFEGKNTETEETQSENGEPTAPDQGRLG